MPRPSTLPVMGMVTRPLILIIGPDGAAQKVALNPMARNTSHLINARLFETLHAANRCEVVISTSAVMPRLTKSMGDSAVSIRRNTAAHGVADPDDHFTDS